MCNLITSRLEGPNHRISGSGLARNRQSVMRIYVTDRIWPTLTLPNVSNAVAVY